MEKFLDYFTPDHYDLDLHIDKTAKTLEGTVVLRGDALKKTVKLHAVDLNILAVYVDDRPADFSYSNNVLSIKLKKIGQTSLKVVYKTALTASMHGAYLSTYKYKGKTETIVATQFESHYAREAFPCIDEPAAKATFTLIITVPDDDIVLSNMPELDAHENTHIFETTPRMSTYLVAFAVGKFRKLEAKTAHGVKVTTYASLAHSEKLLAFANETAVAALDYFDEIFGVPYPLPKLDQLALPDFEAGAMENWGLVTYREATLLAGKNTPTEAKQYIATVITHELSHQWFGNLVTMNWWDDLWLNESFATVIEYLATDHIYPEFRIWESFYTSDVVSALRRDCLPGVQAVKQPVNDPAEISTLFDGSIVYAKGARLMLMLMRLMGEKPFLNGLRDYFKKYAYKNTIGDDLWTSLTPYADFDVKDFMTPWISQPGYPVLEGKHQSRFLVTGKTDATKWPIPEIKTDLSGHYILNLSDTELARTLKNVRRLPFEEKLRLLLDRQLLARSPLVPAVDLLSLLPYFRNETSDAIWDTISIAVADLRLFIETDSPAEERFKGYVKNLIASPLERLTYFAKSGEPDSDARLRPTILSLASYAGDESTIKTAVKVFSKTDELSDLDPETRANTLSINVKYNESDALIEGLLEAYKTATDPEIISDIRSALVTSRNPKTLKKLTSLLKDFSVFRAQDTMFAFVLLMRNPVARTKTWTWLRENWTWIETHFGGDKGYDDFVRLAASTLRTEEELAEYKAFFKPKLSDITLKRAIKVGISELSARVSLIKTDSPAINAELISLSSSRPK